VKRTAMKRRAPMKRTSRLHGGAFEARVMSNLRRARPKRRDPGAGLQWRMGLGPCIVCPAEALAAGATCSCASEPSSSCMVHGICVGPVQGHHAIEKQALKRRGLHRFLDDLRNRVPVCEHRHEQHTSRVKPIPRELLPSSVFEFARELGLTWWLDKHYPLAKVAA
jgi:hypothetical protein